MSGNPIGYISNTYNSILSDINTDNDLKDKPEWFKRLIAGAGDVQSLQRDAVYNNIFLRTSFTRKAVQDLCQLIDYRLTPHSTGNGDIIFHTDPSVAFPYLVTKENLTANSAGTLVTSSKRFEARADVNFTSITDTFTTNFAADNELTMAALDLVYTGHKIRLTTTNTLPAPLQLATDYYVIYVDATHIKLATSLANAINDIEITLTDDGVGVHTLTMYSKAVTVYQQQTLASSVTIGTSDGTEWQEFDLPNALVLEDTLIITISAVTWTKVDTFVDSISTDKHYMVGQKSDNSFYIIFGNGTYGKIPVNGNDITAVYSYGGGSDSNIIGYDKINSYAGSDTNILTVSNAKNQITGGADIQALESAKKLAPLLLKARDRFITVEDGEALALAYGGLSLVKINKNVYGLLSCQVLGIANGGGNPSGALKTAIQNYLIDRSILESIDVRFDNSTITSTNVTSAAKMLNGYSWADVEPFFRLAYRLFLTETGQEIKDKYDDEGIANTVTLINTIFSTSFGASDYDQIAKLIDNFTAIDFGDTINESDVFGYIDTFVDGMDYMTITVFGTGLPLVLSADEITTPGTLTLSEIP